jgi:hypothetical protein
MVMRTSDAKYTGSSVWRECFGDDGKTGKADTMLRKIRRQVQKLCACLNQSDSELDPKQFPLIAKFVTELHEQRGTAGEKINRARTLQQNAETIYYQSKSKLSEQLTLHTRREGYTKLYNQLVTDISNSSVELDQNDLEIVLDAHDLTCTVETLILVTGDLRHIVAAAQIICEITNICEVRYLAVYTPKIV